MLTLNDRIAHRAQAADYQDWRTKVHAVNGCARPIRLGGAHQLQDAAPGGCCITTAGTSSPRAAIGARQCAKHAPTATPPTPSTSSAPDSSAAPRESRNRSPPSCGSS
jgi:hypothetical protein